MDSELRSGQNWPRILVDESCLGATVLNIGTGPVRTRPESSGEALRTVPAVVAGTRRNPHALPGAAGRQCRRLPALSPALLASSTPGPPQRRLAATTGRRRICRPPQANSLGCCAVTGAAAAIRSAGVVVVRGSGQAQRFLVLRAYANWDFPKGQREAGEQDLETAIRETREETGITDLTFPWGTGYRETGPYGSGKIARYYIGVTDTEAIILPVSAELGRPEHDEFRWVSYAEARVLLPPRLQPVLDWARSLASRTGSRA